ncbi:MAG: hypothetical protein C4326_13830 [Ignavibacteria bacterium]
MSSMLDQLLSFFKSLETFWVNLSVFLPQIIGGFLLLIVGWIVAKVVRKLALRFLRFIRLDTVAEKSGIDDFLVKGGVPYTTTTIVANLVYWFILFTVLLALLNSLGLQSAAELFNRIILYIPNVIVAVLVLIFGALFARFVRGVSFTYLSNIGIAGAQVMSNIAHWAIVVFAFSVALEQLSIGGQILISAFQLAFGALCLAFALAFGLGGKEWAAYILEKFWKK